MPIIKPVQKHKYNTKRADIHENGTLNRQKEHNITEVEK
jgi:hypothetical protein